MPSLLVDTSTDGDTLVPAPSASQFIRIIGLDLTAAEEVTITLLSGSTVIWKTYATADPNVVGGIVLNIDPSRTLDCANGQPLKIGLSAAVGVAGTIEFVVKGLPNANLLAGQ